MEARQIMPVLQLQYDYDANSTPLFPFGRFMQKSNPLAQGIKIAFQAVLQLCDDEGIFLGEIFTILTHTTDGYKSMVQPHLERSAALVFSPQKRCKKKHSKITVGRGTIGKS